MLKIDIKYLSYTLNPNQFINFNPIGATAQTPVGMPCKRKTTE